MKKIAFFETADWEAEYLKSQLKGYDMLFFNEKLGKKHLSKIKDINILCTMIYSKIDKKTIDSLKYLEHIATRSTGFDHIDLKACKNIKVSNVPHYGENTVAEHTMALLLALSRKIYDSIEKTKKADFSLEGLRGFDLKGKTLGIIGTGSIGEHVIRMAKGFEMNILAYDIKKTLKVKYVTLNNLLSNSDIVSLHVPYNKSTHHMINLKTLKLFKKGCYLINTARGGVCDTTALLKGLNNGTFSALGLDVLEEECFIKEESELLSPDFKCDMRTALENHMLIKHPKVLVTPHNAFNSNEALMRILQTTVDNIKKRKNLVC